MDGGRIDPLLVWSCWWSISSRARAAFLRAALRHARCGLNFHVEIQTKDRQIGAERFGSSFSSLIDRRTLSRCALAVIHYFCRRSPHHHECSARQATPPNGRPRGSSECSAERRQRRIFQYKYKLAGRQGGLASELSPVDAELRRHAPASDLRAGRRGAAPAAD